MSRHWQRAADDLTKRVNPWHPEGTPIVLDAGEDLLAAGNARNLSLAARALADALPGVALRETLDCIEALGAALCRRIADGARQRGDA